MRAGISRKRHDIDLRPATTHQLCELHAISCRPRNNLHAVCLLLFRFFWGLKIMPHGDFSDLAALVTLGAGLTAIWAPQYYYTDVGPMKAFFEGGDEAMSPNEATLLNLVGASLIFMFWALYSVRWNTVNGKAAAVGTATLATTCGRIAWKMDGGELVFRGWHVLMVLYVWNHNSSKSYQHFRPPSQFKYIYIYVQTRPFSP